MDAPVARFAQDAEFDLDEGEGFDLADLPPEDTGLPMIVRVSDGTGVGHVVLTSTDLELVQRWIALNEPTIMENWRGEFGTRAMMNAIQRI